MATIVLDLLKSVDNLELIVAAVNRNKKCLLSLLCHCKDYVMQSPNGLEFAPNLLFLCTIVTRVCGPKCKQYQVFLVELLQNLKDFGLETFCKVCCSEQGSTSMLNLIIDNYHAYSSIFSLHLLLNCSSRVEQLSFSHFCIEMAKVLCMGCSESEKNSWVMRVFGEELCVEYEVAWINQLEIFDNSLKMKQYEEKDIIPFDLSSLTAENLHIHDDVQVVFESEFFKPVRSNDLNQSEYVVCDSKRDILNEVASTLSRHVPLMLCGSSCSGKSKMVEFFAHTIGMYFL